MSLRDSALEFLEASGNAEQRRAYYCEAAH